MRNWIILTLILSFSGHSLSAQNQVNPNCKDVLFWIHKELTLNNLDLAFERTQNKFLLALKYVEKNSKTNRRNDPEIDKIINSLKVIDPKFKKLFKTRGSWISRFFSKKKTIDDKSLKGLINYWKKIQVEKPNLFSGMPADYLIDEMDSHTMEVMDNVNEYNFTDSQIKTRVLALKNNMNKAKLDLLSGRNFKTQRLKNSFQRTKSELLETLKNSYKDMASDFSDICSLKEMNAYIAQENYVCPAPKKESDFLAITSQIQSLDGVLSQVEPEAPEPTIIPEPTPTRTPSQVEVPVEILDYDRSTNPISTHCKRNTDMVSTIVVHHTATARTDSPFHINWLHLQRRTSSGEPWYMVGYNYLISDSYDGATPENLKVFQGRDPDIQGAHAGGVTKQLTEAQKEFYKDFKVQCGNDTIGYKEFSVLDKLNDDGTLNGNLVSYGVAVIGDYRSSFHLNISGVPTPQNLYAIESELVPSDAVIEKLAKFSCSLQNKNPNVKLIVPHQYFNSTSCPGTIILYLQAIADKAQEYGCEFNVAVSK